MGNTRKDVDVLILGGGPGGLSAALWCADLGLRAAVLERGLELGGQLLWTHNPIRNYLGAEASNGRELRDVFLRQVGEKKVELVTNAEVTSVDVVDRRVELRNGDTKSATHLIIATGVSRRRLGIPGELEFVGKGVLQSGVRDREQVRGKRVVVIGGGDAALENSILLRETGAEVTLVHRRGEFSARPGVFVAGKKKKGVEFVTGHVVSEIGGNDRVEEVSITDVSTGESKSIPCDAVLIRIGVEPNTGFLRDQVERDADGYITVDRFCRTNVSGVFAVGDVANPKSPTISTAVGMGATAAKSILGEQ